MAAEAKIAIPSVTLSPSDIDVLLKLITNRLDDATRPSVSGSLLLQGATYRESYDIHQMPDITAFVHGLELVRLTAGVKGTLEFQVTIRSQEVDPFGNIGSGVHVRGPDGTLVSAAADEIRAFLSKRRNYHVVFHTYGIPIAIMLALLLTYTITNNLVRFDVLDAVPKNGLFLGTLVLGFPVKHLLRWAFPYVLLKGENPARERAKWIVLTLFAGVLANAIYGFFVSGWSAPVL